MAMGTYQRSKAHLVLSINRSRKGIESHAHAPTKVPNHDSGVLWKLLELSSLSRQTTTKPGALRHTIISLVRARIGTLILATHSLTALLSQPSKNGTEKMPRLWHFSTAWCPLTSKSSSRLPTPSRTCGINRLAIPATRRQPTTHGSPRAGTDNIVQRRRQHRSVLFEVHGSARGHEPRQWEEVYFQQLHRG